MARCVFRSRGIPASHCVSLRHVLLRRFLPASLVGRVFSSTFFELLQIWQLVNLSSDFLPGSYTNICLLATLFQDAHILWRLPLSHDFKLRYESVGRFSSHRICQRVPKFSRCNFCHQDFCLSIAFVDQVEKGSTTCSRWLRTRSLPVLTLPLVT